MGVNIGDRFDFFTVTKTAKEAADRWYSYHACCNAANKMNSDDEKIIRSCLQDEFEEMKADSHVMGVGLWLYNQSRRA